MKEDKQNSVIKNYLTTASDGKKHKAKPADQEDMSVLQKFINEVLATKTRRHQGSQRNENQINNLGVSWCFGDLVARFLLSRNVLISGRIKPFGRKDKK